MLRTQILHNRYKTAAIFYDQTNKEEVALCPFCDQSMPVETPGLYDCTDCGKTFEAVIFEGPDDEGEI